MSIHTTKTLIFATLLAQASSSICYGNLRIIFDTDAAGNPIAAPSPNAGAGVGSFTGAGTVAGGIVTGTAHDDAITGIQTGDILTTKIIDDSGNQSFNPDVLTMTTTFQVGGVGSTASIGLSNNGSYFKGWHADGLDNATSFGFTSTFSDPIHGRDNNTKLDGLPWGFATALFVAGAGFGVEDFDVTYTISGLQYTPTVPATPSTLTSTIPTYTPFASAEWDNGTVQDTLVFNSADGFTGLTTGAAGLNNLLVRGFDDENSSFRRPDWQQFYADSFSVLITPKAEATFAADTIFVFSFDGDTTLETVPEPSGAMLLALGGMLGLTRRSRKN